MTSSQNMSMPDADGSSQNLKSVLDTREKMVARREKDFSEREEVLKLQEKELIDRSTELLKIEESLRITTSGQVQSLIRPFLASQKQINNYKDQLSKVNVEMTRLRNLLTSLEQGLKSPDAAQQLKNLKDWDAELTKFKQTLEMQHSNLKTREAELIERESYVLHMEDVSEREAELAGLIAAQKASENELHRRAEELRQREEAWMMKLAQRAASDELDIRTKELDRREVAIQSLEKQLQNAKHALQAEKLQIEEMKAAVASGEGITMSEDLPSYLSDQSVLKADQIRLQERMLAGVDTANQDVSANVLF